MKLLDFPVARTGYWYGTGGVDGSEKIPGCSDITCWVLW